MDRKSARLLKDILPEYLREKGLEEGLVGVRIFEAWDKVLGPSAARYTKDKRYLHGILRVRIVSPVLRSELLMQKSTILNAINRELGYKSLNDIEIR